MSAMLTRGRFPLRAYVVEAPRLRGRLRTACIVLSLVFALMIAVLPPLLSAAALAGLAVGALLLVQPTLALYLLAFSVPYESLHEIQLGGLNATLTEFIAFCGGAAFLMRCAIDGRLSVPLRWTPGTAAAEEPSGEAARNRGASQPLRWTGGSRRNRGASQPWAWWGWALLLFAAAMIASMSQATDLKSSIKELLKLGEMLLTYLLVLRYVDTPARLRLLLSLVVLAALSQALLGIAQTAAHFGPASFARGALLRGSGTFDQPNPFAGYLNLTLPLLFAAVVARVRLVGALTRPALVILAMGVLLSVSRGALLASVIAAALILAVHVPRARPLLALGVIALGVLAGGALVGIVPAQLTDQVATAFGVSNVDVVNPTPLTWPIAERLAHMLAGLRMFADHPLLGVGIGNYPAAYPRYQVAAVWQNPLGHAHNYYINVAAEAGVVGLAAFLVVLVSAFVIAAHLYRRAAEPWARALALGTLGVLATVAVHSFFDDIFVHAMEAQVALVMGMATVACRLCHSSQSTVVSSQKRATDY